MKHPRDRHTLAPSNPMSHLAPDREFIPSMEGILDYRTLGGTPEALAAELRRLSEDDAAYARKFEWQKHPESWGQEFKEIHAQALKGVHTQCQVCQVSWKHTTPLCYQSYTSGAQGVASVSPEGFVRHSRYSIVWTSPANGFGSGEEPRRGMVKCRHCQKAAHKHICASTQMMVW